jgi:hypothetical protein
MGISAMEHTDELKHTAAPLTLELDPATRVTVPPHLTEQKVVEVQRADLGPGLEDAVIVGVDAKTSNRINQAYALVYAPRDGQMQLIAELPLREHVERFQKAWVNTDEPVLVINGISGAHFMDLWVYRFANGEPDLLFANGSAAGAEFRYDITTPVPTIWIGVEDWGDPNWSFANGERRWNVYTWDGDEFMYNERLSSAREMGPEERLAFYTLVIMKKMEQAKDQLGPKIEEYYQPHRSSEQAKQPSGGR